MKAIAVRNGIHPETKEFITQDTVFEIEKENFVHDTTKKVDGREIKVFESWMQEVSEDTPLGVYEQTEEEVLQSHMGGKRVFKTSQEAFADHDKKVREGKRKVPVAPSATDKVPTGPKAPKAQTQQV